MKVKNFLFYFGPHLLSQIISFFTILIAANVFSNKDFGIFTFAQTVFFILFSLSFSNIFIFLQKNIQEKFYNRRKDISTCFIINFCVSLLIYIFLLLFVSISDYEFNVKILLCLISLILLSEPFSLSFNYFFIKEKFITLFYIKTLQLLIFTIIKLYVLYYFKNIYLFALTHVFENIFYSTFIIFAYKKEGYNFFRFNTDQTYIIKILKKIFIFPFIGFAALIAMRIDVLMITQLMNYDEAGFYSAASRTISSILLLGFAFLSFIYPKMNEKFRENRKSYYESYKGFILLSFIITFICYLVFAIFGPYYLGLWGNNFLKSQITLEVLSLNIFLAFTSHIWIQKKYIEKQYYFILGFQFLTIILNIIFNLSLIKFFGASGAAIATLFSNLISFVLINIFNVKELSIIFQSFSLETFKLIANKIINAVFKKKNPENKELIKK